MWLDANPILGLGRLQALKSRWLWRGAISPRKDGKRAQDIWAKGIPPETYSYAIKLVGCRRKRILTPEQLQTARERMALARSRIGQGSS